MTNANSSPMISSDRVEGTSVYNLAGDKLGSVDDLMIDKVSGDIRYAVLEFGGILGLGADRYPLPWASLHYDIDKGGYVVDIDKKQLEGAPRYRENDTPPYSAEYGRGVYDYYSIPWYM